MPESGDSLTDRLHRLLPHTPRTAPPPPARAQACLNLTPARWWTHRFTLALGLTGVAAGLGGVALTLLLHTVQHLAFGYTENTFLAGVEHARAPRRVLALATAGVIVGSGWWLQRRLSRDTVSVTHALTASTPRLPLLSTASDAALQIIAVGAGASLGREGAPRQLGAALATAVAARLGLPQQQQRILLAAGAGAGLAAVYNVPLGGAAFTLEVLLATAKPRAVLPALLTAGLATATVWPFLGTHPTYQIVSPPLNATIITAAFCIGPVAGLAGMAFRATMTRARNHAPTGWRATVTIPLTFTALGATQSPTPSYSATAKDWPR